MANTNKKKEDLDVLASKGMGDEHNDWYKREVERGRRFHGAFGGGFSAGYHNTVGSAEGWTPATFQSSRSKRQKVAPARAEDIGDEHDGLLGRTLAVDGGFRGHEASAGGGRAIDGGGLEALFAAAPEKRTAPPSAASKGAAMLRFLRRRRKKKRYAAGLEPDSDEEPARPLTHATSSASRDGHRYCVGYEGFLDRPEEARGRDVYRVDDALKGGGSSRSLAIRGTSGFALHDDDDDVYDARAAPRALLQAYDASFDDDDGGGPPLLAATASRFGDGPRALLTGSASHRPGTIAGFSPSAAPAVPRTRPPLPRPPRGWRAAHRFCGPPLPSPWLAALRRGGREAEAPGAGIKRRAELLGERAPEPAAAPAPARAALGGEKFAGLAKAMGSRFTTSASAHDPSAVAPAAAKGGLSVPAKGGLSVPAKGGLSLPAKTPKPASDAKPDQPASWRVLPTRTTRLWQPLPLLCKRFGIPVPMVSGDVETAALRDRQFKATSAAAPRVTTAATASKSFANEVGAYLPMAGADAPAAYEAAAAAEDRPEPPPVAEPPRPSARDLKDVFERDDEPPPPPPPPAPAPKPAAVPNDGTVPDESFACLKRPLDDRHRAPRGAAPRPAAPTETVDLFADAAPSKKRKASSRDKKKKSSSKKKKSSKDKKKTRKKSSKKRKRDSSSSSSDSDSD